jgi:hypothetical protein
MQQQQVQGQAQHPSHHCIGGGAGPSHHGKGIEVVGCKGAEAEEGEGKWQQQGGKGGGKAAAAAAAAAAAVDSASSAACNSNNSLPRDDDNDAASAAGASAAPPATTAQLLPQHSLSDYTAVCCAFSFSSSDGTSFSFSGLQLAHLPQPRFQVLMQRHAICAYASACRQCNGILQPATPKQHASAIQYQRASAAAVFRQQRLCFSFSI